MERSGSPRVSGLWLAAMTAVISGVAIFLNGYGVKAWADVADATTYTTAKNLVAALVIVAVGLWWRRTDRHGGVDRWKDLDARRRLLLFVIAVVGGSVPFVLFFEGLARAESAQAAFIHKGLVVLVAIMAPTLLKERLRWQHLVAIGLLMWGQLALVSEFGPVVFGVGERMIALATILWAVEVVLAKRLLAGVSPGLLARARMGGGSMLLVGYVLIRGEGFDLSALTTSHLAWIAITGLSLSAYVLTWFLALSRAQALDVTAILVGGAIITALLQSAVAGVALPNPVGLALVAAGTVVVLARAWKPQSAPTAA